MYQFSKTILNIGLTEQTLVKFVSERLNYIWTLLEQAKVKFGYK